jgi:monovalent cation/proton antiporter MnhG/PhaG subunit
VSSRHLAADLLLALGIGAHLVCTLGVLLMRDTFDRLHYASAGTTLGPLLIGTGVVVRETISAAGLSTIVAVALVFLLGSPLTIATARAAQRRTEEGRTRS